MTRYTPADPSAWIVLTGDRRLLAIDPTAAGRAGELAERLSGDNGFAVALEAIVREGILTAPAFALLDWSTGSLRAVLRGDAQLTVRTGGDELSASGAGVSTWTEQLIEGARDLRVQVPGGVVDAVVAADAPPRSHSTPVAAAESVAPEPATPEPATRGDASAQEDAEATIVPSELGSPPAASDTSTLGALAPADDMSDDDMPDDMLVGDTVYRTVAGAAVRLPSDDAEQLGDHDGETVVASGIPGFADRERPDGPDDVAPAATPSFSLVSSQGDTHPLDRGVVIGRAPSVSQVSGGSIPRLVTISDDADISRNHVRIAIEGDAPVVTDLGSKNGTSIVQPGKPPQRLRGNEPTIVLPGTVVDLGGGAEFTLREDG